MKKLFIAIFVFSAFSMHISAQKAALKTSPFSAVKFEADKVFVEVGKEWYQFLKMNEHDCAALLSQCKTMYKSKYQKRFSEDFVEFLHHIGIQPNEKETFTLRNKNGQPTQKELVFTKVNRKITLFRNREQMQKNPESLNLTLSKAQMLEDLQYLEEMIRNHYSYIGLNNLDVTKELETIRTQLKAEETTRDFGIYVSRFINKFGDGHARISKSEIGLHTLGKLPFDLTYHKENIVCYKGEELLNEAFPYLQSINNIPVEKLVQTAQKDLISDASEQFVKASVTRNLKSYIGYLLKQHDAYSETLSITFTNDLQKTITAQYPLSGSSRFSAKEHLLNDDIGYLKIPAMIGKYAKAIDKIMEGEMRDKKGLIIDVRNNGGGSREVLNQLIPYFIRSDQQPIIGNVAIMRTNQDTPKEGFLEDRFLYPADSEQYSASEKTAIREFMKTFNPKFKFEKDKYSDWHFLLLSSSPEKPFYDKPTVILMDEGCFSATDIFLSSFKQLDNVTLIGTKSSGGSGRAQKYTLPNSDINVRLSSMISFQPNGNLYDRVGVSPDIEVAPASVSDAIGATDNQLDFAKKWIKENQ